MVGFGHKNNDAEGYWLNSSNTDKYNLTNWGDWAIEFANGDIIKGVASCNNTMPTISDALIAELEAAIEAGTMTEEQAVAAVTALYKQPSDTFNQNISGRYCWCRITQLNNKSCSATDTLWVYNQPADTPEDCAAACTAEGCLNVFAQDPSFRASLLGQSN